MCFDPRLPEDFAVFYCPGIWKGVRFIFYAYIWNFVEIEYMLNIWKVVSISFDNGNWWIQMDIIILYGNVFPVKRCSAVESWRMSVHLCGVRKDPGSRFLPCNYLVFLPQF